VIIVITAEDARGEDKRGHAGERYGKVTSPWRQRDEGLFTKSGGQPPRVGPAATEETPSQNPGSVPAFNR